MPTSRIRALTALLTLFLVAGCQTDSPSTSPIPSLVKGPPLPTYPLTLTDDAGRHVTIPVEPERIVSLAPSNTELVCAVDRCDRLVGVTDFDDYPAEVTAVPDVVIGAVVDVELVVAANPDLVLAAGNELTPSTVIAELADLGYPVLVLYPPTVDEVLADARLVGQALGAEAEADQLVADLQARIDAVVAAVSGAPRPRTFYEVAVFEGVIYTAGEGSFLAGVIEYAGGDPITGDRLTTAISLEDLLLADPQLILLGDAAYDPSVTPASVAARPGWGAMAAVREGRVVVMLDDLVVTRPGPRIVDGLEAVARAIHPELFD